ncbi:hypothetical protein T09_13475 [Trichinella sp. T9]|uniref:Uncharacterized protein n=1 Tax=Trichinella murrelli TaxID=144512 RepID=A0A0V0U6H5_9BILA|nr:hypothetical protein T05_5746 [Trichinella murrelli]KRX57567.1 hypothetical protein T09_13475 [Trichinella sp. T9]
MHAERLSTTGDSVGVHSHGQVSEFKAAAAFLQKAKINAKDTRLSHLRRRRYCASGGVQATPDLIVLASSGTCCSVPTDRPPDQSPAFYPFNSF